MKEGLSCADEYIWKLWEAVSNQKDILARGEQDLKNRRKELENAQ